MGDWVTAVLAPWSSNWNDGSRAYHAAVAGPANVCRRNPGYLSGDGGTFDTDFVINKDTALIDRKCKEWGTNLVQYGWGNVGYCGDGCYRDNVMCRVDSPTDAHKYSCCTDDPATGLSVDYCSVDWCKGQGKCNTWLNDTFCKKDLNMLNDPACIPFQAQHKAHISSLCAKPENFRNEACKKFCDAEVESSSEYSAACRTSASDFCKKIENFSDPECACINYDKSEDYTSHIKKFATMANVPSQCWSAPCAKATRWADVMGSIDQTATGSGRCPSQLQVCNQTMNLSDIQAQSLGSISQTCDLNSLKTVTDVTVPPASPGSSPTLGPTASPAPTPTPTSRSFFSFSSGSSGSSRPSNTVLGGGFVFFVCSLIMCAIVLLMLM